jgi:hypothetical protein
MRARLALQRGFEVQCEVLLGRVHAEWRRRLKLLIQEHDATEETILWLQARTQCWRRRGAWLFRWMLPLGCPVYRKSTGGGHLLGELMQRWDRKWLAVPHVRDEAMIMMAECMCRELGAAMCTWN